MPINTVINNSQPKSLYHYSKSLVHPASVSVPLVDGAALPPPELAPASPDDAEPEFPELAVPLVPEPVSELVEPVPVLVPAPLVPVEDAPADVWPALELPGLVLAAAFPPLVEPVELLPVVAAGVVVLELAELVFPEVAAVPLLVFVDFEVESIELALVEFDVLELVLFELELLELAEFFLVPELAELEATAELLLSAASRSSFTVV